MSERAVLPAGGLEVIESGMPEFLGACGLSGPLCVRVEGAGSEDAAFHHHLRQPFAVIGRGPEADIRLEYPEVSRRHAYVQVIAGRAFCVDLESRTGTHWGGGPAPMGWLDPGQVLGIGPCRVGARDKGPGASELQQSAGAAYPTSRAFAQPAAMANDLECFDPATGGMTWQINRALVLLGQSSTCKVRVQGPEVSRFHCSLVSTTAGTWVVDLLSRTGTFLNGERVRSARLCEGDELKVGRRCFRLRAQVTAAGPPAPIALRGVAGLGGGSSFVRDATSRDVTQVFAGNPGQAEPNLMPVLEELGKMQHQMAEQFQQALVMMFRMFSGMHQDQMTLIREELAKVHRLDEKQRSLEAELARALPPIEATPPLRLVAAEPDSPSPEVESTVVGPAQAGSKASVAGPPGPADARADSGAASPGAASERPRPAAPHDPLEMHALLFRRLEAIQEERQGRWQKLIGSLMGKDSGSSLT